MSKLRKIVIAGGCFWGLQELIRNKEGVINTEVGYSGGVNDNPTYENHEGHAEAVEVTFDEDKTTYKNILEYFFRIHNPTTINKQGNDIGDSYRSTIFYKSEKEKKEAVDVIDIVNKSGLYNEKVVTTLEPFKAFYKAEEYHQDYLQKNPGGYTCHYVRSDKSLL